MYLEKSLMKTSYMNGNNEQQNLAEQKNAELRVGKQKFKKHATIHLSMHKEEN